MQERNQDLNARGEGGGVGGKHNQKKVSQVLILAT